MRRLDNQDLDSRTVTVTCDVTVDDVETRRSILVFSSQWNNPVEDYGGQMH